MFGVQKILHLSKEEAKLRAIKHLREVGMAAYSYQVDRNRELPLQEVFV